MEKIIQIGNKDVKLSNNISWAIIYRNQFGQDIIPSLMPMVAGALDIVSGIFAESDEEGKINLENIAKMADGESLINAVIHLGGMEFVDFINLTWALAKSADESIPDPMTWVKGFESFALDDIAPTVAELILKGVVSSKNLMRLETMLSEIKEKAARRIQPENEENESISTQSFSQDSKED